MIVDVCVCVCVCVCVRACERERERRERTGSAWLESTQSAVAFNTVLISSLLLKRLHCCAV